MKIILQRIAMLCFFVAVAPAAVMAQVQGAAIQQDKPIEITSDKLDVFQNEHKAIFTGNVIAIQETTKMRAAEMVVFYRDTDSKKTKPVTQDAAADTAPAAKAETPQGIYRIESQGDVVFTTPTETAIGDKAIYNVDTDTIDLFGSNVTLTRGQNILKGTKLNYNMKTQRSMLTGGAAGKGVAAGGKPSRVHGLFVPKSDSNAQPEPVVKP